MNGTPTPFDHRPDPVLGALLAQALAPGDQAAFVSRVMAAAATARPRAWDVLAGWAGRGIVAVVAALLAGLLLFRPVPAGPGVAETLAAEVSGDSAAEALLGATPPDPSIVFATFGGR